MIKEIIIHDIFYVAKPQIDEITEIMAEWSFLDNSMMWHLGLEVVILMLLESEMLILN